MAYSNTTLNAPDLKGCSGLVVKVVVPVNLKHENANKQVSLWWKGKCVPCTWHR